MFHYLLNNQKSSYHFISTLTHPPLSFVRSGLVGLENGHARRIGENGYDWARISENIAYAYYLNVGPSDIYPSYYGTRWYGFPLRFSLRFHMQCNTTSTLTHPPLSFVRSGYVTLGAGQSWGVGEYIWLWSRVSRSDAYAYFLDSYPTEVTPSNRSDNRLYGFPLRSSTSKAITNYFCFKS